MTSGTTLRLLGGLGLLAVAAAGEDQDLASLHQFNLLSQTRGKTRLMLHNRVRFYSNVSDFYQFRTGPIIYHDWKERLELLAGYYLVQQRLGDTFETIQRPWAGAQFRAYTRGRTSVD